MARVKVRLSDNIARVVYVETSATEGATIGRDLKLPSGEVATVAALQELLGVNTSGSGGTTAHSRLAGLTSGDDHPQYARRSRQIIAGAGLTGGGSFASDRTIALDSYSLASLALADTSVQPDLLDALTFITVDDETADLAASRRLVAGSNITLTTTTPGVITIAASGSGGGGNVASVVAGVGIDVDAYDPDNPIVSLDSYAQASLALADTAVQQTLLDALTFITVNDETADLGASRRLVAGSNITLTTTTPGVITIAASGGGGGGIASIVPGIGIDVDPYDPDNPIVSLDGYAQASLALADSAVQPGDLDIPTFITLDDETALLAGSRRLVAGTNITLDSTTPGELLIAASGGGGTGGFHVVVDIKIEMAEWGLETIGAGAWIELEYIP